MEVISTQNTSVMLEGKKTQAINFLIFRTGIKTKKKAKVVKPLLDNHPLISRWCIDLDDIDNVLKVEARRGLRENDIIGVVKMLGFDCQVLTD